MIDPYIRCPRCDLPYSRLGGESSAYDHYICSNVDCFFICFVDHLTRRDFQLTLKDNPVHHQIFWLDDGTTRVSHLRYDEGGMSASKAIKFDHWLPFDITVEQLKLYLAFS